MSTIVEARALSFSYGAVAALTEVSLALESGSVTALLGDNGAGKSTLIRILSGAAQPTSGTLLIDGQPLVLEGPRAARVHGIATVYQDLALAPLLSVWRNFILGAEPMLGRGLLRRLDVSAARSAVSAELARFQLAIDIDRPAAQLSGGERQILAIVRAIHAGSRVLILDEPTAALSSTQAERVLQVIGEARQRGHAVLLVTHNPAHALAVADAIIVLRLGRVAAREAASEMTVEQITELIAGSTHTA
jgi:simple sugar transport system ATP-binding protein